MRSRLFLCVVRLNQFYRTDIHLAAQQVDLGMHDCLADGQFEQIDKSACQVLLHVRATDIQLLFVGWLRQLLAVETLLFVEYRERLGVKNSHLDIGEWSDKSPRLDRCVVHADGGNPVRRLGAQFAPGTWEQGVRAPGLAERLVEDPESLQPGGHAILGKSPVSGRCDHDPVPFHTLRHLLERGHDGSDRCVVALRRHDTVHLRGGKRQVNSRARGINGRNRLVQAMQSEPVEGVVRHRRRLVAIGRKVAADACDFMHLVKNARRPPRRVRKCAVLFPDWRRR